MEKNGLYKLLYNAGFTDRHTRVLLALSTSTHATQSEITLKSGVRQGDLNKVLKEFVQNGWVSVRKVVHKPKRERIEGLRQYRTPAYGNLGACGAKKEYKLRADRRELIPDMVKKYGKKKEEVLELIELVRGGYS